jgi:hypothetical protein
MTPILVLLFGVHATTAVGTELLYAAITKTGGTLTHGLKGSVDWRVTDRLAVGSIPATFLTRFALYILGIKGWRSVPARTKRRQWLALMAAIPAPDDQPHPRLGRAARVIGGARWAFNDRCGAYGLRSHRAFSGRPPPRQTPAHSRLWHDEA